MRVRDGDWTIDAFRARPPWILRWLMLLKSQSSLKFVLWQGCTLLSNVSCLWVQSTVNSVSFFQNTTFSATLWLLSLPLIPWFCVVVSPSGRLLIWFGLGYQICSFCVYACIYRELHLLSMSFHHVQKLKPRISVLPIYIYTTVFPYETWHYSQSSPSWLPIRKAEIFRDLVWVELQYKCRLESSRQTEIAFF